MSMTTTPDPTTALLAEALDSLWYGDEPASVALLTDDGGVVVASGYAIAEGLLHHPALRAALELGIAWQRAEAALPEGWVLKELRLHDDVSGWGAEAFNTTGVGRYRHMGYGPTPTAALLALAEKLEARK